MIIKIESIGTGNQSIRSDIRSGPWKPTVLDTNHLVAEVGCVCVCNPRVCTHMRVYARIRGQVGCAQLVLRQGW